MEEPGPRRGRAGRAIDGISGMALDLGFDDAEILGVFDTLLGKTGDVDKAFGATQQVMDLVRGRGWSVGKALKYVTIAPGQGGHGPRHEQGQGRGLGEGSPPRGHGRQDSRRLREHRGQPGRGATGRPRSRPSTAWASTWTSSSSAGMCPWTSGTASRWTRRRAAWCRSSRRSGASSSTASWTGMARPGRQDQDVLGHGDRDRGLAHGHRGRHLGRVGGHRGRPEQGRRHGPGGGRHRGGHGRAHEADRMGHRRPVGRVQAAGPHRHGGRQGPAQGRGRGRVLGHPCRHGDPVHLRGRHHASWHRASRAASRSGARCGP